MLRLSLLPLSLFVLLGMVACDKPDEDDPVFVLGTLRTALSSEAGTLQIVALGGNRRSSTVDVAADGSFVLPAVRNRAYTLNVLDSASQTFLGSFLYRAGQNVSLSLSLGSEDLDLGFCQLENGEVFCENGFFDSPVESGAITPANDSLGAVRGTIEATDADRVVLERLLGSLTFELEIQPHPTEPFHIALFNKTYAACDAPFLGTAEANGDERYFYSQVEYSNETCQATVRSQTNCTMKSAVCDGYLRIDILSSGADCTEFPAPHVAHPVRFEVVDPTAKTCALPPGARPTRAARRGAVTSTRASTTRRRSGRARCASSPCTWARGTRRWSSHPRARRSSSTAAALRRAACSLGS